MLLRWKSLTVSIAAKSTDIFLCYCVSGHKRPPNYYKKSKSWNVYGYVIFVLLPYEHLTRYQWTSWKKFLSFVSLVGNKAQWQGHHVCDVCIHVRGKKRGRGMASKAVERESTWLVSYFLIRALFNQWISGPQQAATAGTAWQHALCRR